MILGQLKYPFRKLEKPEIITKAILANWILGISVSPNSFPIFFIEHLKTQIVYTLGENYMKIHYKQPNLFQLHYHKYEILQ